MPPTCSVTVTCPDFNEVVAIPPKYAGVRAGGGNVSPPLQWAGLPPDAKSLVLLAYDPDAPVGVFVHWVVYNLPGNLPGLAKGVRIEDVAKQAKVGTNDFGCTCYDGPSPPPGESHRVFFKVIAVDEPLDLIPPGATMDQVKAAIQGHVVAWGQLVGTYSRPGSPGG